MRWIAIVKRAALALGGLALLVEIAGCGRPDNVGQVSRIVTLNGAPLPGAIVKFQPQPAGSPSAAVTDSSGRYTLCYTRDAQGAEVGQHLVSISTFSSGDSDAEPPRPATAEQIPPQYNSPSSLTATVKSGSNQFDFQLESKGAVPQPKLDGEG